MEREDLAHALGARMARTLHCMQIALQEREDISHHRMHIALRADYRSGGTWRTHRTQIALQEREDLAHASRAHCIAC